MSVGTGRQNIIILFWREQFHFWEYINGNQPFILDSHRSFICSVTKVLLPCDNAIAESQFGGINYTSESLTSQCQLHC